MTWTVPEITRSDKPPLTDERTMLDGWLDFHRQTLLRKCMGLTAEQLKMRSVEPSSLSLLGLVRHMAEVERYWFRRNLTGEEIGNLYRTEAIPHADLDDLENADAEADFNTYAAEIDQVRRTVAGRSLDETLMHPRRNTEVSLRWLYVHMIEEYARHNGHADLIRERIDGATGS
jgi:uncharacterized damage-inducible protein DinB